MWSHFPLLVHHSFFSRSLSDNYLSLVNVCHMGIPYYVSVRTRRCTRGTELCIFSWKACEAFLIMHWYNAAKACYNISYSYNLSYACERSISLDIYDREAQNHFNGSVTMDGSIAVITAQRFVYLIGKYCGLRCGVLANLSKRSGTVSQVLNKPGFKIKLFK